MDILIRGGDAEAAAQEMRAALREIFEIDAAPSHSGGGTIAGTRSAELILIMLTVPPAVISSADLIARSRLGEKLRRLIGKASATSKTTGAKLLVDPGDGKHIPLEEAKRETILAALEALEHQRRKT